MKLNQPLKGTEAQFWILAPATAAPLEHHRPHPCTDTMKETGDPQQSDDQMVSAL